VVPSLEHIAINLVVEPLSTLAELIDILSRLVAQSIDVRDIELPSVDILVEVVVVPHVADRPLMLGCDELADSLGGRHSGSSKLGGETLCLMGGELLILVEVTPRTTLAEIHQTRVGVVVACAILAKEQLLEAVL
jgi:hypothetical protein